jgi:NAD(P)-dependent dehydrogenase (short-subunit alcohol dehydrogenase family)
MITLDFTGKTVLITGGTKGIGLSTALMFAQAGAQTVLTYKWGSADFDELKAKFVALKAPEPLLVQADVSVDEDTVKVMDAIAAVAKGVDIFISNVGYAAKMDTLDDYKKRSLFKTLEYSTWPMVEYTKVIKKRFGKYPQKVVGISSDGPDHYYQGYDFVAASKSLLEFFGKYLAVHLLKEGSRVNVMRFGTVKTESFNLIFGDEFFEYIKSEQGLNDDLVLSPDDCGKSVFALCSGLLDAVNGQIINVDYGLPFSDNTMMRYLHWKARKNITEGEV